MKKTIFLFSILLSVSAFAQSFEGEIIYKNSIKSKNPKMSDDQWTQMMGVNQEYYIKQGNYKSVTNGTMSQWQIYIGKENRIYTKMGNSETILWNDASINTDQVLKSEVKKNVITILGYSCDELILTCKSGVQKYYFTSKLPVEVKLFENHKYANWYDYIAIAKSLTLKTIIETPQFVMETIAVEVKPVKLEDAFFNLPPNTKTTKSPY